jgi:hypothetical protein
VVLRNNKESVIHFTNGVWYSIKDIAIIIANNLNCPLTIGDIKGYNNKLEANNTFKMLNFETDLDSGINEVIKNARDYIKNTIFFK